MIGDYRVTLKCPACDGDGSEIGPPGNLIHFRCGDCGMYFHITTEQKEQWLGTPEEDTGVVLNSDYQPKGVPMKKIRSRKQG